jgi:triacylglycerol lipase
MPFNLDSAITFAQLVQSAEAIEEGDAPNYVPGLGYVLLSPLFANDLETDISPATDYVPFGYVARNGSNLVIALRGTANFLEWVDDAQFLMKACQIANGVGQNEDGFSDVYASLRIAHEDAALTLVQYLGGIVQPTDSIVVCGHSLGAALATLAAYDIALNLGRNDVTLYTYASPNVCDATFAASFIQNVPNAWRIANPFDVVTHVPTEFILGYRTVGVTEEFNPGGNVKPDLLCYHHLQTYLHLMSIQAGQPAQFPLDPECVP